MPRKYTQEWYREAEKQNTALRNDLLAHLPRKQGESVSEHLHRMKATYERQRIREVP